MKEQSIHSQPQAVVDDLSGKRDPDSKCHRAGQLRRGTRPFPLEQLHFFLYLRGLVARSTAALVVGTMSTEVRSQLCPPNTAHSFAAGLAVEEGGNGRE